jgi:hypothetical protein
MKRDLILTSILLMAVVAINWDLLLNGDIVRQFSYILHRLIRNPKLIIFYLGCGYSGVLITSAIAKLIKTFRKGECKID